jgi:ribonucleoside-triphosphate reductase
MFKKAGLSYTYIDAEEEADLSRELGLTETPTVAIVSGGKANKIEGPSNIRKFVNEAKAIVKFMTVA